MSEGEYICLNCGWSGQNPCEKCGSDQVKRFVPAAALQALHSRIRELARWIDSGMPVSSADERDPLDIIVDRLSSLLNEEEGG